MRHKNYAILLIVIVGIGAIGFLGVGLMDHDNSRPCPLLSTTCPTTSGILVVLHHVSVLENLNKADITGIGLLSVLLLLLVVFIKTQNSFEEPRQFQHTKIIEIPYIQQLLFWLVRHNKLEPHTVPLVRSEP